MKKIIIGFVFLAGLVTESHANDTKVPRRQRQRFEMIHLNLNQTVKGISLEGIVRGIDSLKVIINSELVGEGEFVDRRIEVVKIYSSSVTVRAPIRSNRPSSR